MRDLSLLAVMLPLIPWSIMLPHLGVLAWLWLSVMSPHRQVYGFLLAGNLNLVVALATFLGIAVSREKKSLPMTVTTAILFIFVLHFTVVGLFAFNTELHWFYWNRYIRSFILMFTILLLINSRTRIHSLIWVIVLSLGYYGVKGGAFVIKSGGTATIWGPPDTPIGDNNHLALALVMTLPLIDYLRIHSRVWLVRLILIGTMVLTILAVIGSYSRGGNAALLIVLLFFWWRSRRKMLFLGLGLAILIPAVQFMPERWTNRMHTVEHYDEDESLQGRMDAWLMAYNLAKDRPLIGGGFGVFYNPEVFARYNPAGKTWRAPHSIYFEVLGELGFLGLFIFLAAGVTGWFNARWVAAHARLIPHMAWAQDLAVRIQVCWIGYFSAGALLTMAYFEVYWALFALLTVLHVMVKNELARMKLPQAKLMVPQLAAARPALQAK
jgi:putative inorganic carbon (hco3(-)) transporter